MILAWASPFKEFDAKTGGRALPAPPPVDPRLSAANRT